MAVVTHGLKDSIDQILEITRSLERSIESMSDDQVKADSARGIALEDAREKITSLKQSATAMRDVVEDLRRTKA